jgi:hypothetical protein
MNKEQQELLYEAYNNYGKKMVDIINVLISAEFKDKGWVKLNNQGKYDVLSQEDFINKCKTDQVFSEKWGLKIEERELSWEERFELFKKQNNGSHPYDNEMLDDYNIPTKLITIIYNDKTTESYE